jgi:hypothetical protein
VLIVLTAVAMGLRNATVRRLAVPDLSITVLTLTLTGIAALVMLSKEYERALSQRTGFSHLLGEQIASLNRAIQRTYRFVLPQA